MKIKTKEIFSQLEKKPWVLPLLIFTLAFSLRIIAALKMAWRVSEINYVDWIGSWFAENFWAYLFQFSHKIYPPHSETFGSPPFGMWILSSGVYIAEKLHFPILIGARMINVILGAFTAAFLFDLTRRWFNLRTAILSALFFILVPVIIANNGTAYLDTVLALLVLVALDLTFRYLNEKKTYLLYLLGIVLVLSLLTKWVFLPIIFILWLTILIRSRGKDFILKYLIFTVALIIGPTILWSGLRDLNQILATFYNYLHNIYKPYPINYSVPLPAYFYVMLLGVLPPLLIFGFIFRFITLIKAGIIKTWQKNKHLILIIILIIGYITFNTFFARYTETHQLMTILPLVLMVSALGIDQILNILPKTWHTFAYVAISICLILPVISFKPQFWGIYASSLVGGPKNSFKFYSAGTTGEDAPQISEFLSKNNLSNSRIGVVAEDWVFSKYLKDRPEPMFLNYGLTGAYSRGLEYVIIPRIFLEPKSKTQDDFSKMEPVYKLTYKDIILAKIFKIDYSAIKNIGEIKILKTSDWILESDENSKLSTDNNQLTIDFDFVPKSNQKSNDYRFSLTKKENIILSNASGITAELLGDGKDKTFQLVLKQEDEIFLFEMNLNWKGWKKVYIPLDELKPVVATKKLLNPAKGYKIEFVIILDEAFKGQFGVKNISSAELKI